MSSVSGGAGPADFPNASPVASESSEYEVARTFQKAAKVTLIVCTVLTTLGGVLCLYYGVEKAPSFGKYSLLVTGTGWGLATLVGGYSIYRAYNSSINDPAERILKPALNQLGYTFLGPLHLLYSFYESVKGCVMQPTL